MRAVVITDGRLAWQERPPPTLGPEDLLVRVGSAGINGADLYQRAGHYPPPPGLPEDQPGLECAGVVQEVGARVTGFTPGDRVMGLVGGAGQAELVAVHQRLALAVPDDLSTTEAGAFPEIFATAHDALFSQANLTIGERLLVTGAAGGVGIAAVQLGRAAGADVVASVRDTRLHQRVSQLGGRAAGPEEALALGPFDVVLELVGGRGTAAAVAALGPLGRLVVIGLSAGRHFELDLSQMMAKRATLRSSNLRYRALEEKAVVVQRLARHVVPLLAPGRLSIAVQATYPFGQAQEAYEHFALGGKFGKIILTAL
jgi:NADPH:quinone reductase